MANVFILAFFTEGENSNMFQVGEDKLETW